MTERFANQAVGARLPGARRSGRPASGLGISTVLPILLHAPLALLMRAEPGAATAHAVVTGVVGLAAAQSAHSMKRVAHLASYVMGADVLWRMTGAGVFYEYSKYATVAILGVALVRRGRLDAPKAPMLYFLLLLPSSLLTLSVLDVHEARQQLSFNLSGPLAFMVCAWFYSTLRVTVQELLEVLVTALGPLVGIATLALYSASGAQGLEFRQGSNFAASGGFGPNQVSSALGLGAMVAVMAVPLATRSARSALLLIGFLLAAQGALTFSRGGLWAAAAGLGVVLLLLARDPAARVGTSVTASAVLLAGSLGAVSLDQFTGGAFSSRFTSVDVSGRDRILLADLELWAKNPILGVGPGVAAWGREEILDARISAHTEFSRLLAEHGLFGAAALALLIYAAGANIKRASASSRGRALAGGITVWSIVTMAIYAMRTVAQSHMLGLPFVTLLPESAQGHVVERPHQPRRPWQVRW